MSVSKKLKNNEYIDSTGIVHNKERLSSIIKNYKAGTTRETAVANSYVRLFTFELSGSWKTANILFFLSSSQGGDISQLVDMNVRKDDRNNEVFSSIFKSVGINGNVTSDLVAVTTSTNVIEVFYRMNRITSPTINIITINKFRDQDEFGKLTIDCDTVVNTLPSGTQYNVTIVDTIDTGWVDLTLQNGTTAKDNTMIYKPQVRRIGNIVYLKGQITIPSFSGIKTIAKIPSGFLPSYEVKFPLISVNAWIEANGEIKSVGESSAKSMQPLNTSWLLN